MRGVPKTGRPDFGSATHHTHKEAGMRGSLVHRGKNRWACVLDRGYVTDPATGRRRRKQQWVAFRGTKAEADKKLNELGGAAARGEFVEPTRVTVGEWLSEWLTKIAPAKRRPRTLTTYRSVIHGTLVRAFGAIKLQALPALDLQNLYESKKATRAAKTLRLYHSVMSAALKSAVKQGLVVRNVASLVEGLSQVERTSDEIESNCWGRDEARAFLATAKTA